MTWVKLKRGNDWGYEYFERPDADRGPFGTCNRERDAIKWFVGQRVAIRWPDGTEDAPTLVGRSKAVRVSDHGNSYDVSSVLPGFVTHVNGVEVFVSLGDVEVWGPHWVRGASEDET